jgi:hypothetical protein
VVRTVLLLTVVFAARPVLAAEPADPAEAVPRLFRSEKDGKYGFKDAEGNVVIPAKYEAADEFSCGLPGIHRLLDQSISTSYHTVLCSGPR